MSDSHRTRAAADAANAPRLRDVIEAYRAQHKDILDRTALDLLDRVGNSLETAKAFKKLKLKHQLRRRS
jgi:hypothetical protein